MPTLAVVGGGPAGLFAAIEGAKRKMEVVLFERYCIGEKINCAEGFFDFFHQLGEPEAGVLYKVENLIFQLKNSYRLENIPLDIWMIDRSRWQAVLAERAVQMGVAVREQNPVSAEELKEIALAYDWVIDARGVQAARSYRKGNGYPGNAVTCQYLLEGDFSHLFKTLKIGLEPHYFGYYWIFPKSLTTANMGLGWFDPEDSRSRGLKVRQELERIIEKEQPEGCRILKRSGGSIPVTPCLSPVKGNLLVVGDAAGLASPLHGGGMDMACISGRLAANAVSMLKPHLYEKELRKLLRRRFNIERKVLGLWRKNSYENLDRLAGLFVNRGRSLVDLWLNRRGLFQEVGTLNRLLKG